MKKYEEPSVRHDVVKGVLDSTIAYECVLEERFGGFCCERWTKAHLDGHHMRGRSIEEFPAVPRPHGLLTAIIRDLVFVTEVGKTLHVSHHPS